MMCILFESSNDMSLKRLPSPSEDSLSDTLKTGKTSGLIRHNAIACSAIFFALMMSILQPAAKCFAKDIDYQALQEDPITNAYRKLRTHRDIDLAAKTAREETQKKQKIKASKAKRQNIKTAQYKNTSQQTQQNNLPGTSTDAAHRGHYESKHGSKHIECGHRRFERYSSQDRKHDMASQKRLCITQRRRQTHRHGHDSIRGDTYLCRTRRHS
jgi:predicted  nucleic acid-binding Zn-ribbon protein